MILRRLWHDIRSSFWFVPSLLVLLAVSLAVLLVQIDVQLELDVLDKWPRLFGSGADGARGLLSTVASSMITVAGVVFSITIVALSLASSQYTSRVLRTFMGDRVNQTVLGVFVGIFAYCLIVLRTIRGGDEGAFVPSLAVLGGLLLAFLGIAVLIYFIHHISTSIQVAHILAAVSNETQMAIDSLFPERIDQVSDETVAQPQGDWHPVFSVKTGFVQSIDTAALLQFACERDIIIRIESRIGQFAIEGVPFASVLGAKPNDEDRCRIVESYSIGRQRTVEQDAAFGIRQIVDVALKALSPGINDTTTAIMCVNYLTAILIRLSDRRIEENYCDDNGHLRLLNCSPTYAGMVNEAFDQIRQNAGGNVAMLESLLSAMELLGSKVTSLSMRRALREHVCAIIELCRSSISISRDREQMDAKSNRVIELLGSKES